MPTHATRHDPAEDDPRETWGGGDLVVLHKPSRALAPDEDPWGRSARRTLVITPHAEALGWLLYELWEVYVDRGWPLGKYGFLGRLADAALVYQDGCGGSESERDLLMAVLAAAKVMAAEIDGGVRPAP